MKKIFLTISIILSIVYCNANFKLKFDREIAKVSNQRLKEAKEGNPYYFMILGYYINANNIMYTKTKEVKYLQNNAPIINAIIRAGKPVGNNLKGNVWKGEYRDKRKFASVENKEVPLYEGYVFRYIAEFYYIIKSKNINLTNNNLTLAFLEDNFDKWSLRSKNNYSDFSMLHRERLHMGAQWSTTALFLYKITGKNSYKTLFTEFNNQLKSNLYLQQTNKGKYYVWNATYNNKFTKSLKRSLNRSNIIQDVSHGNHVVQYILDAYKLNEGGWTSNDIKYLSNTLKYSIWNPKTSNFADNVDGSGSRSKEFKGTGWKQADGWMKLIEFDPNLKLIYNLYYSKNQSKIDNYGPVKLQFYALMF
ncbi:hypothetical protein ACFQ2C_12780 [Sphingobacterium daejeonense]|uniref:Uncharacterized protein n=1 Tax=Sphingobacterium daejeonense TaxID=371142 RepID=A0ABW3RMT7_9SPHI